MTTQEAFALALQHHQSGRLADAEALYRQILAVQPSHADALHFLGIIAHQTGRHDLAVERIRQALALIPNHPAAHSNLGAALVELRRFDEAIAAYHRALELDPGNPGMHHNLGIALHGRGRLDEAVAAFRRALELQPDLVETQHRLGGALAAQGRFEEAVAAYRRTLQFKPGDAVAYNNLGTALAGLGQLNEALAAFHRATELKPTFVEALGNLGNALREQGRFEEAVAVYRRVLQLQPNDPNAHNNLGIALTRRGQLDEAAAAFQRALALQPDYPEAHNNLGNVFREGGRFDEALAASHRALELRPDYPEAHYNLGGILAEQGRLDEALAAYRQALHWKPDYAEVHHSLLGMLHFHPGQDERTIAAEHQRWNQQFAEPLRKLQRPQTNNRDPQRRLRIGYVSPNFRRHPIAHFFKPLLEAHDPARVEVYCYASVKHPDDLTERLKRSAHVWRDVLHLEDHALAERIREDQIDILVDLNQHMEDSRLRVFARKPAPVQVAWLGYAASTGLAAMDCRITDRLLEPEGSDWSASVETPVRLPDCWFCFDPIESPEPAAPPALRAGHITFGCLNHFYKVSESVLRLWVKVLQAVPSSRLLLHCPAGATQTRLRQWFEAQGFAAHRLDLISRTVNRLEYLQLYQRIDIGLDPFPFNGGTTTCEALWMGVPVVSLAGRSAVSRLGLSILTNLGLPEWAASSEDDYIRIAAQLAGDLPHLEELRRTLRPRLQASPVMDAPRFARNIEAAYRTLWQQWCAENPSPSP